LTPVVNPETTVAELLEAHPEAEAVLIELAPRFKALSNPLLRRTVARVTSLEQAARVGGLEVRVMITALRAALGVDGDPLTERGDGTPDEAPSWVGSAEPVAVIDAGALLAAGEVPVAEVSSRLAQMVAGGVLEVVAPFNPAPLVDAIRAKGHHVHLAQTGEEAWTVWIQKV
jgi:TusA-related sulfurtransferase